MNPLPDLVLPRMRIRLRRAVNGAAYLQLWLEVRLESGERLDPLVVARHARVDAWPLVVTTAHSPRHHTVRHPWPLK